MVYKEQNNNCKGNICGKDFGILKNLKTHINSVHEGLKKS